MKKPVKVTAKHGKAFKLANKHALMPLPLPTSSLTCSYPAFS